MGRIRSGTLLPALGQVFWQVGRFRGGGGGVWGGLYHLHRDKSSGRWVDVGGGGVGGTLPPALGQVFWQVGRIRSGTLLAGSRFGTFLSIVV